MPITITTGRVAAPSRHQLRDRAIAVTAAVLAALVAWAVAVPLLGAQLLVRTTPGTSNTQTIGAGFVLVVSLLASLLGWGLLAALERFAQRAAAIWTVAAGGVLVVSLAGPLTAAVTPGGKLTLVLLHLSVAAVLIPLLRRTAPR